MEVHLSAAQQASLNDLAIETGRKPEEFVAEAVTLWLAQNTAFRERVQLGIDQLDRGEYLDEEEMDARFKRMLRS